MDVPIVELSMLDGRPPAQRRRLLEAVGEAVAQAFCVPAEDICLLCRCYGREDCLLPEPAQAQVVVAVRCFPGRTSAQKERLYRLLLPALRRAAGEALQPLVVVEAPPLTDWGMPDGRSAARRLGKES